MNKEKMYFLLTLINIFFFLSCFFYSFFLIYSYIEEQTAYRVVERYISNKAHSISFVSINKQIGYDYKRSLSILYVESRSYQYAKSHKNAYGYMQLRMPTAKEIGIKNDIRVSSKNDIYDSSNNFYLSISLLDSLLKKYGFENSSYIYNSGMTSFLSGIINYNYWEEVNKELKKIKKMHKEMRKEVIKSIFLRI